MPFWAAASTRYGTRYQTSGKLISIEGVHVQHVREVQQPEAGQADHGEEAEALSQLAAPTADIQTHSEADPRRAAGQQGEREDRREDAVGQVGDVVQEIEDGVGGRPDVDRRGGGVTDATLDRDLGPDVGEKRVHTRREERDPQHTDDFPAQISAAFDGRRCERHFRHGSGGKAAHASNRTAGPGGQQVGTVRALVPDRGDVCFKFGQCPLIEAPPPRSIRSPILISSTRPHWIRSWRRPPESVATNVNFLTSHPTDIGPVRS